MKIKSIVIVLFFLNLSAQNKPDENKKVANEALPGTTVLESPKGKTSKALELSVSDIQW